MGFYVRDSIRVGPFRFNLSRSGVGVSVGLRGARVGMSPRGNYVHLGRHGLYYRSALPAFGDGAAAPSRRRSPGVAEPTLTPGSDGLQEIESGDVSGMRDASSEELLREIAEKRARPRSAGAVLGVGALLVAGAAWVVSWAPYTVPAWLPAWTPLLVPAALAFGTAVGLVFALRRDSLAKSVVLFYQLEGEAESYYEALHDAFADMRSCHAVWHVEAAGASGDWKRSGGSTTAVRRTRVSLGNAPPAIIKTNIAVPAIPCGRETLYLFPDRVLVFTSAQVGAVSYTDLQVVRTATNFVEEGALPRDAEVVGTTWQYVDRGGGPDRRFKSNRQLSVARYDELHLRSASGLDELLQLSRAGSAARLVAAVAQLARVGGEKVGPAPGHQPG